MVHIFSKSRLSFSIKKVVWLLAASRCSWQLLETIIKHVPYKDSRLGVLAFHLHFKEAQIQDSTFNRNSTFFGFWALISKCTVRLIEILWKNSNSTFNRTVRLIEISEYLVQNVPLLQIFWNPFSTWLLLLQVCLLLVSSHAKLR